MPIGWSDDFKNFSKSIPLASAQDIIGIEMAVDGTMAYILCLNVRTFPDHTHPGNPNYLNENECVLGSSKRDPELQNDYLNNQYERLNPS